VDFKCGCVFRRPEIRRIEKVLESGRFVHIEGVPSSGKSVIALTMAYEALKTKRTVIYFERPAAIPDLLTEHLANPFAKKLDRASVLVIVDDVHLDLRRASHLFSFVYNQLGNMKLVFISRPVPTEDIGDEETYQFAFTKFMPRIEVSADAAITDIADHYSLVRYHRHISDEMRRIFSHECANDLLLLGRYLREWDGTEAPDIDGLRRSVHRSILDDLERLRGKDKGSVHSLLILAIFYRFEIPVERS